LRVSRLLRISFITKVEYIMGKNQHVVPKNGKWSVKGAGNSKSTKDFNTQKEAIDYAREIAKNQKSELFIHRKDGTIRDRDSHGNDPYPPEG
jgi:predicted site-specific integrase-resolvase